MQIKTIVNRLNMKIIDLAKKDEQLYFKCLEDWSEEIEEAGDHKENWYNKMKGLGLGVRLAVDDNGEIGGMIQYVPIEYAAEGNDLYFINCIWVHGYKEGVVTFKKRDGKSLAPGCRN